VNGESHVAVHEAQGQREQRGERPHRAPRPLSRWGTEGCPLVVTQATEKEQQGGVRT
jgi:hypothetical protein